MHNEVRGAALWDCLLSLRRHRQQPLVLAPSSLFATKTVSGSAASYCRRTRFASRSGPAQALSATNLLAPLRADSAYAARN